MTAVDAMGSKSMTCRTSYIAYWVFCAIAVVGWLAIFWLSATHRWPALGWWIAAGSLWLPTWLFFGLRALYCRRWPWSIR